METIDEQNYLLNRATWSKYDMTQIKKNVIAYLQEYKEAKSTCVQLESIESQGLTTNLDPNKSFNKVRSNNGGFAEKSNKKIDAERIVERDAPILNKLRNTFTERERIYFDYCLAENYKEIEIVPKVGKDSKESLKPIKNSCLLKIAWAFKLETPLCKKK